MKKLNLFLSSLIFLLFSCSTDNIENNELTKKDLSMLARSQEILSLYEEIINEDDLNLQKRIFSTFDVETQSALLELKIKNFKENNSLNEVQLVFLDDLKDFYSPQNIELILEKNESINQTRDYLLNQSKILFGEVEGFYLLSKFENINQTKNKIINNLNLSNKSINNEIVNKGTVSCSCKTSNNCTRLTGFSVGPGGISFQWEYGTCNQGGCKNTTYIVFDTWEITSTDSGTCKF